MRTLILYCVHCNTSRTPEQLLPLKGRRKLVDPETAKAGTEIGRCKYHLAPHCAPVALVYTERPDAIRYSEWKRESA